MRFSISLFLDRFRDTEVIKHKINGREMKGVFIPFRHNNVYATKYGYLVYLNVSEIRKSKNGNTHFIRQYVPKKMIDAIRKGEMDRFRAIGYMKPIGGGRKGSYNLVGDGHFDAALSVVEDDKE